MRYVQVFEHDFVPLDDASSSRPTIFLTRTEADQLLRLNLVRKGFCHAVPGGLKFSQYCGVVTLQTCTLEVLPKVGFVTAGQTDEVAASRTALLAMLRKARRLKLTPMSSVKQMAVDAPLLDIFVQQFLHCALDQARRGVLSRYVQQSDDLRAIRGRFNAESQIRRNLARPHLLHCDYEEFTVDNPHNRAIRAALRACRGWVNHPRTRQLYAETQLRYEAVSLLRMSSCDVQRLPRERATSRYESVLEWCEWILATTNPTLGNGMHAAPGMLFDMNKLFEAHVSQLELEQSGDDQTVLLQAPQHDLATEALEGRFTLRPDITIWRGHTLRRIIDAKWKLLDLASPDWGVDQADVYQMLAYAVRYRCPRVELVYPMPTGGNEDAEIRRTYEISQATIHAEPCKLTVRAIPVFH
ncbi:MAG: restriction endonuclease [Ramlibacter sp.]|nr:restriction endonuclease [Ramlibacter sp.]